jgi:hypothetical protein
MRTATLHASGVSSVSLWTGCENTAARKLYEVLGLKPTRTRRVTDELRHTSDSLGREQHVTASRPATRAGTAHPVHRQAQLAVADLAELGSFVSRPVRASDLPSARPRRAIASRVARTSASGQPSVSLATNGSKPQ